MASKKLTRTTYVDPRPDGAARTDPTNNQESHVDFTEYHQPLEQVHCSGLHGWGVAAGLHVTATLGQAKLTVEPGIALDSSGLHISLAVDGQAEVHRNADNPNESRLTKVLAGGVDLETTGLNGPHYLTVRWRETLDVGTLTTYGMWQVNHTPWLKLFPIAGFNDEGSRVVLARVEISDGKVQSLATGLRRATDAAVGSLQIKGLQVAGAPALAVTGALAGAVRARDAGGLSFMTYASGVPTPAGVETLVIDMNQITLNAPKVGVGLGTVQTELQLDVANRMRVRQGSPADTAGIWFYQQAPSAHDRAFVGMLDDTQVGFYGANGGWGLRMNTANGRVGIGLSPADKILDVANRMRVRQGSAVDTAGIWFYQQAPAVHDRAFVGMMNDNMVGFYGSQTADRGVWGLVMDTTNGNVGVGTSTPKFALDVVGTVATKGNLYVRNNAGGDTVVLDHEQGDLQFRGRLRELGNSDEGIGHDLLRHLRKLTDGSEITLHKHPMPPAPTPPTALVNRVTVKDAYGLDMELKNGMELPLGALARGLQVALDRKIDPGSVGRAICTLSVEIPYLMDRRIVGYQPIALAGSTEARTGGDGVRQIAWMPLASAMRFLKSELPWPTEPPPDVPFDRQWRVVRPPDFNGTWSYDGSDVLGQVSRMPFATSNPGTLCLSLDRAKANATVIGLAATIESSAGNEEVGLVFNYVNDRDLWLFTVDHTINHNHHGEPSYSAAFVLSRFKDNQLSIVRTQDVLSSVSTSSYLDEFSLGIKQTAQGLAYSGEVQFRNNAQRHSRTFTTSDGPSAIVADSHAGFVLRAPGLARFKRLTVTYPDGFERKVPPAAAGLIARLSVHRDLIRPAEPTPGASPQPTPDFQIWFWLLPEKRFPGGYPPALSGRTTVEGAFAIGERLLSEEDAP